MPASLLHPQDASTTIGEHIGARVSGPGLAGWLHPDAASGAIGSGLVPQQQQQQHVATIAQANHNHDNHNKHNKHHQAYPGSSDDDDGDEDDGDDDGLSGDDGEGRGDLEGRGLRGRRSSSITLDALRQVCVFVCV